jgi:hypothetical protein
MLWPVRAVPAVDPPQAAVAPVVSAEAALPGVLRRAEMAVMAVSAPVAAIAAAAAATAAHRVVPVEPVVPD